MRYSFAAMALLMLASTALGVENRQVGAVDDAAFLVGLETLPACRICPGYAVRIFEDGRVTYIGKKSVATIGEQIGYIAPEDVSNVKRVLAQLDVESLKSFYPNNELPDAARFKISVRGRSGVKEVLFSAGAPQTLFDVVTTVRSAVNARQWICPLHPGINPRACEPGSAVY